MSNFDWYTIELCHDEYTSGYAVYGHGEYEESSVLAGQYRRCFVEFFEEFEDAKAKYPNAEESGSTKFMSDQAMAGWENSTPPSWFDPLAAGEEW